MNLTKYQKEMFKLLNDINDGKYSNKTDLYDEIDELIYRIKHNDKHPIKLIGQISFISEARFWDFDEYPVMVIDVYHNKALVWEFCMGKKQECFHELSVSYIEKNNITNNKLAKHPKETVRTYYRKYYNKKFNDKLVPASVKTRFDSNGKIVYAD